MTRSGVSPKPLLVLVTGLPGTGKSTIAAAAAEALGTAVLAHDWALSGLRPYAEVQAALDAMGPTGHREVGWSLLVALARAQFRRGSSVVLDGVARRAEVEKCRRLASEEGASSVVVLARCSDITVHRSRVEGRDRGIPNWYELDWPHVEKALAGWEPPTDVDLGLDAVRPIDENLALLRTVLSRRRATLGLRADRDYLTTVAYADDRLLKDRVSLYEHQHPRIDLVGEALARLGSVNAKTVGDIGCGNGAYLAALAQSGAVAVGLDLSPGMLDAAPSGHAGTVVADAQHLPLATASLDAALAMHMLYHVPDPALAVAEVRRVLRPGGRFVAAIGGPGHLAEANQLWVPLLREAGVDAALQDIGLVNSRLSVDRLGALLRESFADVGLDMLASQVVLHSAAPLVRHASSTTAAKVAAAQGAEMAGWLALAVEEAIARDGAFRVTTEVAMFTAQV